MSDVVSELPMYPMARDLRCPFDPPPQLRELQREGDVVRVRLWDDSTAFLITRYEEQRSLLADPRVSAERERAGFPHTSARNRSRYLDTDPSLWRTFLHMDNPEHQTLRRMLTADFTLRRMELMRPKIQQIVDDLIDDMLDEQRPVDLVEAFALPVPSLVICELLGVPYEDRDVFQRCSRVMVDSTTSVEALNEALKEFTEYVAGLVAERDREPGDDLISRLVVEQVRTGNCTAEDVVLTARLLLFAGHETTANMIALGTLALLEHPDQLSILRETDDPRVVGKAVEELLRYLSIVHSGRGRVATADIELGDTVIPEGAGLIMSDPIGNRDPRAFAAPDALDVEREARHHIAFGYGVHQCLGQPLARVELQVVYGTLYRRIPALRLAVPLETIRFKSEMGIYGVHALPVTW